MTCKDQLALKVLKHMYCFGQGAMHPKGIWCRIERKGFLSRRGGGSGVLSLFLAVLVTPLAMMMQGW